MILQAGHIFLTELLTFISSDPFVSGEAAAAAAREGVFPVDGASCRR